MAEHLDGWWLRYGDGSAWWASSVLPHSDAGTTTGLLARIRCAEKFYAGYGTRARFQISPGACPPGLDRALAERGYRIDSPMSLRVAPAGHVPT